MHARFRYVPIYLVAVVSCYLAAWIIACIVVNGDLSYSAEYFRYFWTGDGSERPVFTGILSIVLTIPFSLVVIWMFRSRVKNRNEEHA
jgi:hypothetical protein